MLLIQRILVSLCIIIFVTKTDAQENQSYDQCTNNDQCTENSYCHGNDSTGSKKCKCNEGFNINRLSKTSFECLPIKNLGDPCQTDDECQRTDSFELAICSTENKVCTCNSESYNNGGICYIKAKLGEVCMENENCYIEGGTSNETNALCITGRCECQPGQFRSEDNMRCITTKKLGQRCHTTDECALADPKTICSEICVCDPKYTESADRTACVEVAEIFGDPCEIDGQCSKYLSKSICKQGHCGCLDDSHEYETRCVRTRKRDESCEEDAECFHGERNLKCFQGACVCRNEDEDGVCKSQKVIDFQENNSATKESCSVMFTLLTFMFKLIQNL